MLIGDDALSRLSRSHVLILGLGGVGSFVCEALARAGVGELSLLDSDSIEPSNLNRQLYALRSTIGRKKTELAKARCEDIDPEIRINVYDRFLLKEEVESFLFEVSKDMRKAPPGIDLIIDAIDSVGVKIELARLCELYGFPLVSCCGTGNKLHPELFRIADIYDTKVCPLCRVMRRELKKLGVKKLTVCYSDEPPIKTHERTPASISFVPSSAGLLIASYAVRKLARL